MFLQSSTLRIFCLHIVLLVLPEYTTMHYLIVREKSMKKIRVGVLMGGKSLEREVSFNSGRTICDHLDTHTYTIIPLFQTVDNRLFILPWRFLYRGKISDFLHRLEKEATELLWDEVKNYIDFMYIALHGQYAEDGTLQGMLEIFAIPYLGSKVFSSALGMDKILQKKILAAHNITTPHGIHLSAQESKNITEKSLNKILQDAQITFPVIVKPAYEGSSLGVSCVFSLSEALHAIHHASTLNPEKPQPVLLEKKVTGMEFSCITLFCPETGKPLALPPTEVVIEKGTHIHDYAQKYMPGRAHKITPARCPEKAQKKIQDTCLQVMQALHMSTFSRIDGFLQTDGTVVIVDPNTLSGMGPSSFLFNQAAEIGMNHTDVINHLIATELTHYPQYKNFIKEKQTAHKKAPTMKLAVLFGGTSNEKEISLESGRNVVYKLSHNNNTITPLFVNKNFELFHITPQQLVHNTTQEIEETLLPKQKQAWHNLKNKYDFVFIALHGGKGENGCVQGMLEMMQIPYNGSGVATSALCMNKYETNQLLRSEGIAVPQSVLITKELWDKKSISLCDTLHFPCIVKPHNDGCSVGVTKISSQKELITTLEAFFASGKESAMVEEYITGIELTVGVIGNQEPQVLPASQAVIHHDILTIEEKFLPGAGENQTPAPLSTSAQKLVRDTIKKTYQEVGCSGYARIDCFYQTAQQSPTKKERVIILEINTLPALTPATCLFHQAAELDITPMQFLDTIIKLGQEKHSSSLSNHKTQKLEKIA